MLLLNTLFVFWLYIVFDCIVYSAKIEYYQIKRELVTGSLHYGANCVNKDLTISLLIIKLNKIELIS